MIPRGVAYMVASALAFSAMSVLVKIAGERLPTGEIVLARAVVTLVVSYLMVRRAGVATWGTNRSGLVVRGILGFCGLTAYYLSLAYLPLAEATTFQQMTPLWTSVLAWFVLRERIGWTTALALACGIGGVLLIMHPSGAGLDPVGVAIALAGSLCSATAYVTVRQLSRTEDALVIVFYFPLVATPLAIPWAAATWVMPEPIEWLLLLSIGLTTQVGQVFLTRALMIETAGRATSVGYIQIAFAMVWQWTVFSSAPTLWTLGGALLIILGTAAVARASRRATRSDRSAPPPR